MDELLGSFREIFSLPVLAAVGGVILALGVWPKIGGQAANALNGMGVPEAPAAVITGLAGAGTMLWLDRRLPAWASSGAEAFAGVALYGAGQDAGLPLPSLTGLAAAPTAPAASTGNAVLA